MPPSINWPRPPSGKTEGDRRSPRHSAPFRFPASHRDTPQLEQAECVVVSHRGRFGLRLLRSRRLPGRGGAPRCCSTPALRAVAVSAASRARGDLAGGRLVVERRFPANRLEDDIEVGKAPEPGSEQCQVEIVGAQNVEHRRARVEERLHVEKLQRPAPFLEDPPADRELLVSERFQPPRTLQIRRTSRAQQPWPIRVP